MDSLASLVQSPFISRIASIIYMILLGGFFWWRVGSIYILLERVWRLIAGNGDVIDPTLKSLLNESRDLEKFQFMYRLKVESLADIYRLAIWLNANRISISSLQKARKWIDLRSEEIIKIPSRPYIFRCLIVALISYMCLFGLFMLSTPKYALLQMRESKVWFKTDATRVIAPFGAWSFGAAECDRRSIEAPENQKFLESELESICNALNGDELRKMVKDALQKQLWAGLIAVIFFAVLMLFNILAAKSASHAMELRKLIKSNSIEER